jgi:integrase
MRLRSLSPITITDRLELVHRLAAFLAPDGLLTAGTAELAAFQRQFSHCAPATLDVYVRHVQAFYRWAIGRELLADDPSLSMIRPKVRRGRPHPISLDDLRVVLACTVGALRTAYVLAAFAGLRRGEICRLRREDLDLATPVPVAHVDGKGGKLRVVPLLPPVVTELERAGLPRRGWIVTYKGGQYPVEQMSVDSHRHLHGLGLDTTMHSMRHLFATQAYRSTRDLLMLAELLGHSSVATTQIYAEPDMEAAHDRLAAVSELASDLLGRPKLYAVR